MRVYKEVDYEGMVMPDHVPRISEDPRGLQAQGRAAHWERGRLARREREARAGCRESNFL
jgi:hypothetical protein